MPRRIQATQHIIALALIAWSVNSEIPTSHSGGIHKLESGTAPPCASKLEFSSLSNATGHYVTSLLFDEKEIYELPAKLEEVGGSPSDSSAGLRARPRFSRLSCDEPTLKTTDCLEMFIQPPDADHSPEHPHHARPRRNRHVKRQPHISIRYPKKGYSCFYNELQSTANKTISSLALGASPEPKNVNHNSWWKSSLADSAGAILATMLGAIFVWLSQNGGLWRWSTRREPDGSDAAQSNDVEEGSTSESDNDETQNSIRNERQWSSVMNGDASHAETISNVQVGRDHTTIDF